MWLYRLSFIWPSLPTSPSLLHSLLEGWNGKNERFGLKVQMVSPLQECASKCQLLSSWRPWGLLAPGKCRLAVFLLAWGSLTLASVSSGSPERAPWVTCSVTLLATTIYVKYIKQESLKIFKDFIKNLLKHTLIKDKIIKVHIMINTLLV